MSRMPSVNSATPNRPAHHRPKSEIGVPIVKMVFSVPRILRRFFVLIDERHRRSADGRYRAHEAGADRGEEQISQRQPNVPTRQADDDAGQHRQREHKSYAW